MPARKTTTQSTSSPAPERGSCNVEDCVREPAHRGLCPAHWMSHRGLANPVGAKTS